MNSDSHSRFLHFPVLAIFLVVAGLFLVFATGCVGGGGYAAVGVSGTVADDDDYVYYPGYEVYYSNVHHRYYYRDGDRWVARNEPDRRWAGQIKTAPSVHMDFHDAPEHHHADVVKRYPRTWHPEEKHEAPHDRDHDHDHDTDGQHH